MAVIHKMFYVRSATAPIREVEFEIIVTGKRTWAQFITGPKRGRRVLVGGKAFYLLSQAVRVKLAALHKARSAPYAGRTYFLRGEVEHQLRQIEFVRKVFH